ncbi:chemotaxis protein CheW [Geobacter sp.]|uniref:chemotaxis protein CheW n=1 Tax=Geobacter sp. TaxID=46610 RepID=UPI002639E618|nr:chemotaxis protein CheW [Geobacter sp.]
MMDIAEIRKKAQREREQGKGASRPAAAPNLREESVPAAEPFETADTPNYDDFFPSPSPGPFPVAVPTLPPVPQDPLTIILEGRKAALAEELLPADADAVTVQEGVESLEILCFRVADEIYGIDIMELREIIKPRETTEIPHAPAFIAGVLSLRGIIIPVFVLRHRLGLGEAAVRSKERIIVVKRGDGFCGLLVDEVTQVVRIDADSVEHPPAVLDGIDRDFVGGIGRHEGKIIILLNLDKVLDAALC